MTVEEYRAKSYCQHRSAKNKADFSPWGQLMRRTTKDAVLVWDMCFCLRVFVPVTYSLEDKSDLLIFAEFGDADPLPGLYKPGEASTQSKSITNIATFRPLPNVSQKIQNSLHLNSLRSNVQKKIVNNFFAPS